MFSPSGVHCFMFTVSLYQQMEEQPRLGKGTAAGGSEIPGLSGWEKPLVLPQAKAWISNGFFSRPLSPSHAIGQAP